jgi:EmrB/QacA subfamily drug resistance transporter
LSERAARSWFEPAPLAFFARRPSYPWLVVGTVCIGAFMGQVDASIVQLVLPELEVEFQARVSEVSWVAVAYLLAVAALLPIFGRLADLMGRKPLYTAGFLIFVFGSALCGLAPTLGILIAARVVQGIGAALVQANSVAIIVAAVGRVHRGRAIGIQAAAQAVGLSAGPALGGLVISSLGWRWVFFLNLPVGLAGSVLAWLLLPQTERVGQAGRFDWQGALVLAPALTCLMVALNEGAGWGFTSPALLGCLLVAAVLLGVFIRREMRTKGALLDLELFRNPVFAAGNIAGMLSYGILFGIFFLLPFVLERVYRFGALGAGLYLAIIPVLLGGAAPVSGWLSDRLGARWLTVGGMLIVVVGLVLLRLAIAGEVEDLWLVGLSMAIFGLGQGLFIAPNNSAIMASASPAQTGEAGGLLNLMRSLGMSAGIALAAAVLSWQLASLPGRSTGTLHAPRHDLIAAAHLVIVMFAGFAVLAAIASLIRPRR